MAPQRQRRRWGWLVAGALFLLFGAWLMTSEEPPQREATPVHLPKRMTRVEAERNAKRQTWLPPAAVAATDAGPAPRELTAPRDPVLAAIPAEVKRVALVVEVNAIVNSELGGLLMECLMADDDTSLLSELRDAGFDPTTKLDRVALIDDTIVFSGDFRGAHLARFLPADGVVTRDYGAKGKIYQWDLPDGGTDTLGAWGEQLLIGAPTEASLRTMLDRLNGSSGEAPGAVDAQDAYGEVYGVLSGDAIATVIGRRDEALGETLRSAAKAVKVHVDVSHDVGLVGDVEPSAGGQTEELRRSLGSALSLARMQAQAKGATEEAAILDLASVRPSQDGRFRLEAGLPHEYLRKGLTACVDERRNRQQKKAQPAPHE